MIALQVMGLWQGDPTAETKLIRHLRTAFVSVPEMALTTRDVCAFLLRSQVEAGQTTAIVINVVGLPYTVDRFRGVLLTTAERMAEELIRWMNDRHGQFSVEEIPITVIITMLGSPDPGTFVNHVHCWRKNKIQ